MYNIDEIYSFFPAILYFVAAQAANIAASSLRLLNMHSSLNIRASAIMLVILGHFAIHVQHPCLPSTFSWGAALWRHIYRRDSSQKHLSKAHAHGRTKSGLFILERLDFARKSYTSFAVPCPRMPQFDLDEII